MNISERLRVVIEEMTPPTRRFIALEEATEIKSESWRTWWNRSGKASPDMIQAVARAWPQFALWITIGITDQLFGHEAPKDQDKETGVNMTRIHALNEASKSYMKLKIQLQIKIEEGDSLSEDELWQLERLDHVRWSQVNLNRKFDDEHPSKQSIPPSILRGKRIEHKED